jgi:hypothetical protein
VRRFVLTNKLLGISSNNDVLNWLRVGYSKFLLEVY